MFKKLGILLIVVLLVGVLFYFSIKITQRNQEFSSQVAESATSDRSTTTSIPIKTSVEKLKEYNDPVGFSFKYSTDLELKKQELKDDSLYSQVELTAQDTQGAITIKFESTKETDLEQVLKKNKLLSNGIQRKKVKLADLEGELLTSQDSSLFVALDQDVLLTTQVTYKKNKDYWDDKRDTIISTFTFVEPESSTAGASTTSEDEMIEETEEVIE